MQEKNYTRSKKVTDALRKHYGKSVGEFADFIGVSPSTVSSWSARDNLDADLIYRKCAGVNFNFLLTGEGEIFVEHISEHQDDYTGETCQKIDIYNMVDAGHGAEPDWHEPIDSRLIPSRYIRPGVRPVLVRGRSMEPTYRDGAIIGIDQNQKHVVEGEAYAVLLPYAGAAVKRIYPLPDGILIRSDNKEFPEVKLCKTEVPDQFILGRVCWVIQEI